LEVFVKKLFVFALLCVPFALSGCCEGEEGGGDEADLGVDMGEAPDQGGEDAPDQGEDMPAEARLECEGAEFAGEVASSAWARRVGGVWGYRYEGAHDRDEVVVEALGEGGEVLLTMRERQVPEGGDGELPDGAMVTEFDAGSLGAGSLWSSARATPDGYALATRLNSAEGELRVEARFVWTRCWPEDGEAGPACAAPLSLGEGGVTLHDCGLGAWEQGSERAPRLAELVYVAPGEAVEGEWRLDGARRASVLTVFDGEAVAPAEAVTRWAQASGADAVLGTTLERLLSAAHLDRAWRWRVQAHAERCAALEEGAQRRQGLSVRRQGLSAGGPGRRDRGRSLASGLADLDRQISDAAPIKEFRICVPGTGCGSLFGDPHMVSFDGLYYEFQGVGEFVLVRGRSPEDDFEIQGRMSPPAGVDDPRCQAVSLLDRVAVRFQGERWEIDLRDGVRLFREGEPFVPGEGALSEGWGVVFRQGSLTLSWPDGTVVQASGRRLLVELSEARWGQVEGLLGRADGSGLLYGGEGAAYRAPLTLEALYAAYGESWRVSEEGSLFVYEEGEGPERFHDRAAPGLRVTLSDFAEGELSEARAGCAGLGLMDPLLLAACVLDSVCVSPAVGAEAGGLLSPRSWLGVGEPQVSGAGRYVERPARLPEAAPRSQGACAEDGEALALVFEEAASVRLSEALEVDVEGAEGALEAGVTARVFGVYLAESEEVAPREVRIDFGVPVLGVVSSAGRWEASDAALGMSLAWPDGEGRGLEEARDAVTVEPGGRAVVVRMDGRGGPDAVRILTEVAR
jgi:hypothetical protein